MKKNDPNNFVFFYLKKQIGNSKFVIHNYDEENLNYFVSSIKKFHPNSKIIQCTDFKTPKVIGVDEVFRINIDQKKIMEGRIYSYSKLNLFEPSIYLDIDMLITRKIPFDLLLDKADVILLKRSFNKTARLPVQFRGQTFAEHQNGNLGEIYPYIGCFVITKANDFWNDCQLLYKKLKDNYKFWFGDQKVLKEIVKNENYKFAFLEEEDFACPPQFINENKQPFTIHFKGKQSKTLIKDYYNFIK